MHPSVQTMWRAYLASLGPSADPPPCSAWHFCDNARDADACARLVLDGRKRATAPSVWELEATGEPLPRVGDVHVVTDWAGVAQCVIRTTAVEILPFSEVTAEHAALEGEGDGSLAYWRRVHRAYYTRQLRGTEYAFSEDMPIAFEQFEVVFPAR